MHLYAIESRLNWSRQSLNGGRHYRIEHNEPENLICSKVNFWFRWEKGRKVKDHFIFSFRKWRGQCTVVELSTRTALLNIDQSLQFGIFWSQSKALFMITCMLSAGSGSKTFGALKVSIFLNFQYIKWAIFCVFLHANGQCQMIFLLKKITQKFSVVVSCC